MSFSGYVLPNYSVILVEGLRKPGYERFLQDFLQFLLPQCIIVPPEWSCPDGVEMIETRCDLHVFKKTPLLVPPTDFVVFSTRIRETQLQHLAVKEHVGVFLESLVGHKIVLLGDKEVETVGEKESHILSFDNVYRLARAKLGKYIVLDRTVKSCADSPDLKMLKEDMEIISAARFVVTIGYGGNFVMNMVYARQSVCWTSTHDQWVESVLKKNREKTVIASQHHHLLANWIRTHKS